MTSLRKLSKGFKFFIITGAICGLLFFLVGVPILGESLVEQLKGVYTSWYYPWLIFIEIEGIPCFIVLLICWRIAQRMSENDIFNYKNAQDFHQISCLSLFDSITFIVVNIVYFFLNMNHLGFVMVALGISFIGIAFAYCIEALSLFIKESTRIKEENDLTI